MRITEIRKIEMIVVKSLLYLLLLSFKLGTELVPFFPFFL